MPRLATPSRSSAPAAAEPLLAAVERQLGSTPNLFLLLASSPPALEGFLGLNSALAAALNGPTRERIALAVAEFNGCDNCLSAHAYLGANLARLSDVEIELNRAGGVAGRKGRRSRSAGASRRRNTRARF